LGQSDTLQQVGVGFIKIAVLLVGGAFVLGFALPALLFAQILKKYRNRFDRLVAQIEEVDGARGR
jgi:hypothetical protein